MAKVEINGMKNPTVIIRHYKTGWVSDDLEEKCRYMYDALYAPLPRIGERMSFRRSATSFEVISIRHCLDTNEIHITVR